jgi:Flp pilus assembly protein TadD
MKARSRFLVLLGVGAIACVAIVLGFRGRSTENLEPVTASVESADVLPETSGTGAAPVVLAPALEQAPVPKRPSAGDEKPFAVDPHTDYLALGQGAFARGDWAACVDHLQRAAVRDPQEFRVHYLLGLALRYQKRFEESNVAFDRALEIAPRDLRALVNGARTLLDLARPEDAEARVRQAVEIAPEDGEAWNVLGRAQLALGRLADAEASFVQATTVDSTNAYAHNNLGLLRLQRGEWREAAAALETAVRCKDDVAYFHHNLGLAYERQGRLADAAAAYTRTLELQPNHAMARIALARVTVQGQPALAVATAPSPDSAQGASAPPVDP